MIISASRRTDIPAFYSDWLVNRIDAGFVLVRNPMNAHQISRVALSPDVVDCFVFWTKNPLPMMDHLDWISRKGYPYYFLFSLTPYNKNLEKNLPDKKDLLSSFISLSRKIGKERVVWRYDPILLNEECSLEFHMEQFARMAAELEGYTDECIISFVDIYPKMTRRSSDHIQREPSQEEMMLIAREFARIGASRNIRIKTCSEQINLSGCGIAPGSCIDRQSIERILGCAVDLRKDSNQRKECGCMESIDIGAYGTCVNGCVYCYATKSFSAAEEKFTEHNPLSPIITGEIGPEDTIYDRKMKSSKIYQLSLPITEMSGN